jgi:hypothetical protein
MTFVHGIICRLFKVFSFPLKKAFFHSIDKCFARDFYGELWGKYSLAFITASFTAFLVQYPTS